jgi:hypothetical protein
VLKIALYLVIVVAAVKLSLRDNRPSVIHMNSDEDISKAAASLVSTLKRLHEELLELDELLQHQGRSLYEAMTVEDWLGIIGVLSNLSERSGVIARICVEIHQAGRLM